MHRSLFRASTLLFLIGLLLAPAGSARAQTVILAFGDSLTLGFGDGNTSCFGGPQGGYPPRLESRLEGQGLDNEMRSFGVCGELTSQGVTRIDGVLDSNTDADVVIIMEGTNDLSNNGISTESMRFNINEMAEKALDRSVRPVIASPIPRGPEAGSNDRTGFLAALLREDTDEKDIDYADQFNGLIGVTDLFENFYADPFHPNSSGYSLVAGQMLNPVLSAASRPLDVEPCVPGDQTLCLNEERFQIEVEWRDFDGNEGVGQAVSLTSDTGYFWFFDPANVELVLKVLDGQAFNERFWVFYGALSTVQYTITVTDTERGLRRIYNNPLENLASVGDTSAFPGDPEDAELGAGSNSFVIDLGAEFGVDPDGATRTAWAVPFPKASSPSARSSLTKEEFVCVVDDESLCLNQSRFQVRARWADFDGNTGVGRAVPLTSDTGYFWFFSPTNVEVMVKVLDGLGFNNAYWVFFGALTNVELEVEVTDTMTGEQVLYTNPLGNFGSRADTSAFPQPEEPE
ncbi:MAG: GDSL-type esterase/lipase family protein [Acidobacteriota bacterium]